MFCKVMTLPRRCNDSNASTSGPILGLGVSCSDSSDRPKSVTTVLTPEEPYIYIYVFIDLFIYLYIHTYLHTYVYVYITYMYVKCICVHRL